MLRPDGDPLISNGLAILPVSGIREIRGGDDLGAIIGDGLASLSPMARDIIVVAQKIVSKAEGAIVDLERVSPSATAVAIAARLDKDPRLVEVILSQSKRIVRMRRGVLITETLQGFVCANSGIDASNVDGAHRVTLLPSDPDASATRIRQALESRFGCPLGVIVSDSFNRPWRLGSINVALGTSGLDPLADLRGRRDDYGAELKTTLVSIADEVACAAQLVMGETGRVPAALVRGLEPGPAEKDGRSLLRDHAQDLFR